MLIPIYIPVLIFTLEVLVFLFSSHDLDRSVRDAARDIRVGVEQGDVAQAICSKSLIPGCSTRMTANVRIYDNNGNLVSQGTAAPGRSTLAIITAEMPVPATFLVSTLLGSPLKVSSAFLFRTEPF